LGLAARSGERGTPGRAKILQRRYSTDSDRGVCDGEIVYYEPRHDWHAGYGYGCAVAGESYCQWCACTAHLDHMPTCWSLVG
jgi:hypothetical protein